MLAQKVNTKPRFAPQTPKVTMSRFLPTDYKAPSSSTNYMKLQEGENKIRILSAPIIGWEDWIDKKPERYRLDQKPLKSHDPKMPIRHFWAFIVWNYAEEQIQILQISQATIRSAIEALCNDAEWGAPYSYDIKIVKRGEGTKTEYTVSPSPHKAIADYIIEQFNEKPCWLEALFTNEDPFGAQWKQRTMGCFETPDSFNTGTISNEQADELLQLLEQTGEAHMHMKTIVDKMGIASLKGMSADKYQGVRDWILTKIRTDDVPF